MALFDLFKKKTDVEQYRHTLEQRREARENPDILLQIEDTFSVKGRGTVVVGKCRLSFSVGDAVLVQTADGSWKEATVSGLEKFRSKISSAAPGDKVGVLLEGIAKTDAAKGTLLKRK